MIGIGTISMKDRKGQESFYVSDSLDKEKMFQVIVKKIGMTSTFLKIL